MRNPIVKILKIILWQLTPPNSRLELFVKSFVDRVLFHNLSLNRQIERASESYKSWVHIQEKRIYEYGELAFKPTVSFLAIPPSVDVLQSMIRALQGQQYQNW